MTQSSFLFGLCINNVKLTRPGRLYICCRTIFSHPFDKSVMRIQFNMLVIHYSCVQMTQLCTRISYWSMKGEWSDVFVNGQRMVVLGDARWVHLTASGQPTRVLLNVAASESWKKTSRNFKQPQFKANLTASEDHNVAKFPH